MKKHTENQAYYSKSLHIYKAVVFCIYKPLTKQNLKMETIKSQFSKTFFSEQLHKTFGAALS